MNRLLICLPFGLTGCLTLDGMLPFHNNIPCSEVNDETCNNDEYWDRVCLPCEDPYDWDREYEWREETLTGGATIRGIDPALVTDAPFDSEDGDAVLDAYFIAAHGDVAELGQTTIIFNHGRFASIDHYLPRVQMLHELVREPTLRYHLQIPRRLTEQLEAAAERKPESKLKPK